MGSLAGPSLASHCSHTLAISKPDFPFLSSQRGPDLTTINNFQDIPRFNFLILLQLQLFPSLFPPPQLLPQEEGANSGVSHPVLNDSTPLARMVEHLSSEVFSSEAHSGLAGSTWGEYVILLRNRMIVVFLEGAQGTRSLWRVHF